VRIEQGHDGRFGGLSWAARPSRRRSREGDEDTGNGEGGTEDSDDEEYQSDPDVS
jgi:hypothetical protein